MFLSIPENDHDESRFRDIDEAPLGVPEWDPEPVKAGLGPVLPVPLKNPPGREVTATVWLNGWKKVLARITSE